jgi:hypothetical protein
VGAASEPCGVPEMAVAANVKSLACALTGLQLLDACEFAANSCYAMGLHIQCTQRVNERNRVVTS